MLDKGFFNSRCAVRIVQEKNSQWTDELNKLRKHTRKKLRAALQNNVQTRTLIMSRPSTPPDRRAVWRGLQWYCRKTLFKYQF